MRYGLARFFFAIRTGSPASPRGLPARSLLSDNAWVLAVEDINYSEWAAEDEQRAPRSLVCLPVFVHTVCARVRGFTEAPGVAQRPFPSQRGRGGEDAGKGRPAVARAARCRGSVGRGGRRRPPFRGGGCAGSSSR